MKALSRNVRAGVQLILVSSGSIAAGTPVLGLPQASARSGHPAGRRERGAGILVAHYSAQFGEHDIRVGQVLLTAEDLIRRTHYRNAQRTLDVCWTSDYCPSSARTTRWPPMRSSSATMTGWPRWWPVVQADGLVLLTDIDGLYDRPPRQTGARQYRHRQIGRRRRWHRFGRARFGDQTRRNAHQGSVCIDGQRGGDPGGP